VDGNKNVGSIDETNLMREVLANPKFLDSSVKELMDAPFPIVDIDAEISFAVEHLMKKVSAVLVQEGNKIVGVITKYDVLEYLAK